MARQQTVPSDTTGTSSAHDNIPQSTSSNDNIYKAAASQSESSRPQTNDALTSKSVESDLILPLPSSGEVSSFFGKLRQQVSKPDSSVNDQLEIPPLSDLFKISKASLFGSNDRTAEPGTAKKQPLKNHTADTPASASLDSTPGTDGVEGQTRKAPEESNAKSQSDLPQTKVNENKPNENAPPAADEKKRTDEPAAKGTETQQNISNDALPEGDINKQAPTPESNIEPTMSMAATGKLAEDVYKEPAALNAFKKDLVEFEIRSETDRLSMTDKMEFYGQVGRVLKESKSGNKIYSSKELQTIASDMVRLAHQPGLVNQGADPTCTTAALETALYIQEPATIARMVADVATTGQYVTTDGTVLKVLESNLHPDKYKADTPEEKKRSLASQIAQPALINIHWARQDEFQGETGLKGKISYEEGYPPEFNGDNHNRMMNYSKTPPEPFTETETKLDPTSEEKAFVQTQRPIQQPSMQMSYLSDVYKQLRGNKGDLTIVDENEGEGVTKPNSEAHFKKIVEDAQARNKPILLGVHANRGPFLADLLFESDSDKRMSAEEKSAAVNMHAYHALVGYNYDKNSGDLAVENQWGTKVDHTGKPGQKERLSLAAVYDTILDKPTEANSFKPKEPTPDDFINQQRQFIETLEKDDAVSPKRIFEERTILLKYLRHWGHKEEAHKQAELMSKQMLDRIKNEKPPASTNSNSPLRATLIDETDHFLTAMKIAGEKQIVKDVLSASDERFSKTQTSGGREYLDEFSKVLKLHKNQGGGLGADKFAEPVVSKLLESVLKHPEDIASKEKREIVRRLASILHESNATTQADRLTASIITNLRTFEETNGKATIDGVDARAIILYSGSRSLGGIDLRTQMSSELQENYDALKVKGDISSPSALLMRTLLTNHYANQWVKDPEKLHSLVQDSIQYLLTTPDKDGSIREGDSAAMIPVYENLADKLVRGGGEKYALPIVEKTLEIAKGKSPDNVEELAYKLVALLDEVNRSADADKVLKDNNLKGPHFRLRKR